MGSEGEDNPDVIKHKFNSAEIETTTEAEISKRKVNEFLIISIICSSQKTLKISFVGDKLLIKTL